MLLSGLLNSIFRHTVNELILLAEVVDGPRNTKAFIFGKGSQFVMLVVAAPKASNLIGNSGMLFRCGCFSGC